MSEQSGESGWVQDDCGSGYVFPMDRQRAEGILKIHAPCEPPCPRKQTAADYLDGKLDYLNAGS